jgi:hypothetical protein
MKPLSKAEAESILNNLDKIPVEEQREVLALLEKLESIAAVDKARDNLLAFSQAMNPSFLIGALH